MSTQCVKETIHVRDSCLVLRNEGLQTFVHAYNVIVDSNTFLYLQRHCGQFRNSQR